MWRRGVSNTFRKSIFMLCFVWIYSFVVSFIPVFGLNLGPKTNSSNDIVCDYIAVIPPSYSVVWYFSFIFPNVVALLTIIFHTFLILNNDMRAVEHFSRRHKILNREEINRKVKREHKIFTRLALLVFCYLVMTQPLDIIFVIHYYQKITFKGFELLVEIFLMVNRSISMINAVIFILWIPKMRKYFLGLCNLDKPVFKRGYITPSNIDVRKKIESNEVIQGIPTPNSKISIGQHTQSDSFLRA